MPASRRVYVTGSEQLAGPLPPPRGRGDARRRRGHRPPPRHQRASGAHRARPRPPAPISSLPDPHRRRRVRLGPACAPTGALDVELVVEHEWAPGVRAASRARPPRSPTSARGSPGCRRAASCSSTPTSRTRSCAPSTSRTSSTSGGRRSARPSSARRTTSRCCASAATRTTSSSTARSRSARRSRTTRRGAVGRAAGGGPSFVTQVWTDAHRGSPRPGRASAASPFFALREGGRTTLPERWWERDRPRLGGGRRQRAARPDDRGARAAHRAARGR